MDIGGMIDDFTRAGVVRRHDFLSIRYFTSISEDGGTLLSLTVMPLWIFLLPSMTWITPARRDSAN